jgi:hypothetical protein
MYICAGRQARTRRVAHAMWQQEQWIYTRTNTNINTGTRSNTHPLLADVALQLPSLLLDGLNAIDGLHLHGV